MSSSRFSDLTDILKLGLDSQDRLADLNSLVSSRIRSADYSAVHDMLKELLRIAENTDIGKDAAKEKRLDELSRSLSEIRMELLMEAELLASLRHTNDHYISLLELDIKEAEVYLGEPADTSRKSSQTDHDTMQKRADELKVTKTVALAFSEQIRLSEAPLISLAERILSVLLNLIPLLRGRISAEKSRFMAEELRKLISVPQPS